MRIFYEISKESIVVFPQAGKMIEWTIPLHAKKIVHSTLSPPVFDSLTPARLDLFQNDQGFPAICSIRCFIFS
jgi:hypothetical protein